MRSKLMLSVMLGLASAAYAKEPRTYQTGQLLQMQSVRCGTAEKDAKSVAGEIIGTDSGTKKTEELLCQEYVLQSDKTVFHIRPRDEKHPALLPVGDRAEFRLEKDKMLLHMEGQDKDREYSVVSMSPRSENASAEAMPASPNHLQ
jgi:hypothetical protein